MGEGIMLETDIDLLAIGEILIDFISTEKADRLLEATAFRRLPGGSPANLAVNVARLGKRAALLAKMGAGPFGQFLKAEIQRSGVITDYLLLDPGVQTSLVFVSQTSGTPDFEPYRSGDYQLTPDEVPEEAIQRARLLHTTTWPLSRQPSRSAVLRAVQLAHQLGRPASIDPNYSPKVWPDHQDALRTLEAVYPYITLTKASLDDAGRLFGPGGTPEDYIRRFHDLGPETVVFTLGKEGSLLSQRGQALVHLPARPVKVVDATGAGDSFWAGFLTALLDGQPPERCLRFARQVVELKLQTIGTLPENLDRRRLYEQMEAD
jgi:sugar/nucleoside kinase (ribokinase family)